jgi:NTE family protein
VLRGVIRPGSVNPKALMLAALPGGFIPTTALSEGLDALFCGEWPQEALWVCSYDQRAGTRVVFGRDGAPGTSVGKAVAASSAIPSHFAPVLIDGRHYVDGGVHSMLNLDVLGDVGLDLVLAISPLTQASPWPALTSTTVVRQFLGMQLRVEVAALRARGVEVAVIQPGRRAASAMGINPMDAARRGEVSRAARVEVDSWLAGRGKGLASALRGQTPKASKPKAG